MSPFDIIRDRVASCTGLSNFYVFALMSIGVPSRAAGTPLWGGTWCTKNSLRLSLQDTSAVNGMVLCNHTWTEIWDAKWYFTGSNEYNPNGLDKTWFYPSHYQYQRCH